MTVLDIRGTHGSGKSYIPHYLLANNEHESIEEEGAHVGYWIERYDLAILGKYSNACGGCDGIKTADEVVRRVRSFNEDYSIVMLEGILVSHTFKRYHELAQEIEDYRFLFLDTPKKACIARVLKRRKAKGQTKEFNPKNLLHDHRQIWERVRPKMEEAGHTVMVLNYKTAVEQVEQ